MSTRDERRAAAYRYRDALTALDDYIDQKEAEQAAGLPVVTGDEHDFEWQTLNEALDQARREAPWWAPLRWQRGR